MATSTMTVSGYKIHQLQNSTTTSLPSNYSITTTAEAENIDVEDVLTDSSNILLLIISFVALVVNVLSVAAILNIPRNIPRRHTAHLKILISLSLADIVIILSVFVHIMQRIAATFNVQNACFQFLAGGILDLGLLATLLNLMLMGIDRYFAIMNPLRHISLMSNGRTKILITIIWVISPLGMLLEIIIGALLTLHSDRGIENLTSNNSLNVSDSVMGTHVQAARSVHKTVNLTYNDTDSTGKHQMTEKIDTRNFCEQVITDKFEGRTYCILGLVILEMIAMTFLYSRIYLRIRRRSVHQPHQDPTRHKLCRKNSDMTIRNNQSKNRSNTRTIVSSVLIVGTFMLCWLPNSIFQITIQIYINLDVETLLKSRDTLLLIHEIFWILMVSNALCDPIIYGLCLRQVQLGYKSLFGKLSKCLAKETLERRVSRSTQELTVNDM